MYTLQFIRISDFCGGRFEFMQYHKNVTPNHPNYFSNVKNGFLAPKNPVLHVFH